MRFLALFLLLGLALASPVEEAMVLYSRGEKEANRILSPSSPHPETGTRREDMLAVERFEDELEEALERAGLGLKGE
ncbi:hypothetical protein Mesil_3248 (plasmid) [Allomeiothermus silvanus DSM 9946]|uniref:Uncharacterized protein n=1 Tax=Allomeiothermus silvanus (strain ATCC 700542 / DSM 9946 / NBRC 106475 / NCIMB 13440 / VI-R2) TaxID=526227 RepID=D7BIQ8_ALLS1|nr:hypothetical protein [Allomeiothermus silvanus]ADH65064.1 hypothetical protein Mesil_3248 [Allomeiothermus silvanus DSM 9946]